MKRVLMLAFHFPPHAGSSGIQRTLRFVRHLPEHGWSPLVLSAHPMAYERTSDDLLGDIPDGTIVRRAFALNSARHLAIKGRYLAATARPDRWISWKYDAIRQGMQMIEAYKPDLIWSTYPIATAHVIAAELHQRSGLPWVADFRDPMAQPGYPADPVTWQQFAMIERSAIENASLSVFTTPGAVRTYQQRYPAQAERCVLLENGYDEDSFVTATRDHATDQPLNPGYITLLHSGLLYAEERDPNALFAALAALAKTGATKPFRIRFRAAGNEPAFLALARQYGIETLLEFMPPLPYTAALAEMLRADGLLVLQAGNCNEQIPAKLYEYFRARRPIIGLTDSSGDTAGLLRDHGIDALAPLDDPQAIADILQRSLNQIASGTTNRVAEPAIRQASRAWRSEVLAGMFDQLLCRK